MDLRAAVCFAILMENGVGIVGKHPDYILEKLRWCEVLPDPTVLLDERNMAKARAWAREWLVDSGGSWLGDIGGSEQ